VSRVCVCLSVALCIVAFKVGERLKVEVHRIWIRIRIRPDPPDPNSLDPVNRIHYHVVPITVSMVQHHNKLKICLVYCLL